MTMQRVVPRYHAFTIKHNGITNRILSSAWVLPAFDPANPPSPIPPAFEVRALWDTGATSSVITKATASRLELTPTGTVNVNHAGGTSVSHTYMINVGLPNNVAVSGVLVSECPDTGDFGMIIGMDIITRGDFALTNMNGETVLSFCFPSRRVIDYVVETNKEIFAGVGRNDPCPCGKKHPDGRSVKFKSCHGAR